MANAKNVARSAPLKIAFATCRNSAFFLAAVAFINLYKTTVHKLLRNNNQMYLSPTSQRDLAQRQALSQFHLY
jgi:hypothetical protein